MGGEAYECQDRDEDDELGEVRGAGVGEDLPEEHKDCLGAGHGPDGAVEVAALGAFAEGGTADTGEFAESAEEEDQDAERGVGVVVDLLEVPGAANYGDDKPGQVEEGKAQDGVPGKGVADAAVERVGLVFVEAQYVGAGFCAGKASAEGGDAGSNQDDSEPDKIARVHAVREKAEGERAGGEEEDPDPDGPVGCTVEARVAAANLALVGQLYFSAVAHRRSLAEALGARQSVDWGQEGCRDWRKIKWACGLSKERDVMAEDRAEAGEADFSLTKGIATAIFARIVESNVSRSGSNRREFADLSRCRSRFDYKRKNSLGGTTIPELSAVIRERTNLLSLGLGIAEMTASTYFPQ